MSDYAERADEKRRVKLEDMKGHVKNGTLKIPKMTAQERKRFPPRPSQGSRP